MSPSTFRRIALAATLAAVTAASADAAPPEGPSNLAEAIQRGRQLLLDVRDGAVDREALVASAKAPRAVALPSEVPTKIPSRVVGTWFVKVPGGDGPQFFYAYQTFNADGTFVETSSLLGTLTEGPAHGAWAVTTNNAVLLTFELFGFGPPDAIGRFRVRVLINVTGDDLVADTEVDVLDLEGNLLDSFPAGPYTGKRVKVQPF
jgi:hypothetical protein